MGLPSHAKFGLIGESGWHRSTQIMTTLNFVLVS